MDAKKKPELRFKGFEGEWERNTLGEKVFFYRGLTYSPSNIVKDNGTLILRSSNIKNGEILDADNVYVNSEVIDCENVQIGDVIVVVRNGSMSLIGKHAQIKSKMEKTVIGAFMTGLRPKQPSFTNALLDIRKFNKEIEKNLGATINQITTGIFKKMLFSFPAKESEQTKIGDFFKNIDNLISLSQRKHDKLVDIKKAFLEKMFPKNGADTPEIRFKGFHEMWKESNLNEIVVQYENSVQIPNDGYIRLGIRSHAKGTFHSYIERGKELQTAKMHKVASHKLIVNITFAWEHAVAITDENDEGKLVSHRFPQFSFRDGMIPLFFKYVIIDERFKYHLWRSSPGGAGRNRVLKIDSMLDYSMKYPSESEQTKIGKFFQNLDHLISLRKQELEKLKNIKKACLEKMFI